MRVRRLNGEAASDGYGATSDYVSLRPNTGSDLEPDQSDRVRDSISAH